MEGTRVTAINHLQDLADKAHTFLTDSKLFNEDFLSQVIRKILIWNSILVDRFFFPILFKSCYILS